MRFQTKIQDQFGWLVEFLDPWIPRSDYAIGGGAVLAARWNHRLSTDIDMFAEEDPFRSKLDAVAWRALSQAMSELETEGAISELSVSPMGFRFKRTGVPIFFYSTPRMTTNPVSSEREDSTGIATESTAEIMFKKLRGRMVNSSRYVARDLYDVIVCYKLDTNALSEAMGLLIQTERASLKYDVQSGDARVNGLDRVLEPRFTELVADFDRFNRIAGEVLSEEVSSSTEQLLSQIGI